MRYFTSKPARSLGQGSKRYLPDNLDVYEGRAVHVQKVCDEWKLPEPGEASDGFGDGAGGELRPEKVEPAALKK